ncbi:MAG: ATP-binding protein [Acidimicrobiia bacterium]
MAERETIAADVVPVGRVIGTEDSTPLSFWVAIAPGQYLQLDDVVVTDRELPEPAASVTLSGVVTQVRARQEGARFDSDVFLVADGVLPAETVEAAEVSTTRVEPETFVPPRPGAAVRRALGAERDHALLFDAMERKLPIGLGRDGAPLYANVDFLDGTRGAHVSISGVSGVATKTTYATFLLYSLFHSGVLGPEANNTKALIFNVKGEDLLFLDQPNIRLDAEQEQRYHALGLVPRPFESVAIKAPPRRGDPNAGPDTASRTTGVSSFYWTIADFVTGELLPFVFADAEDERQQYTMVIHQVMRRLADGEPVGDDGRWRVDDVTLTTYHDLVELIVDRLNSADALVAQDWAGRAVGSGTINAFVRRLLSSQRSLSSLIRADIPLRADRVIDTTRGAQVTVVDIHNLAERAQRFVVGVTVKRVFEAKEESGARRPLLFLVLDELNKYAPREGTSPIKEILLDVAERGRSLGLILVGAQQTASEVERRVIANSAIRVAGRLDPAEASRPEYGFLPAAHRERARIAKPGTMFVSQPQLSIPLVVEFPFPAWATRPEECAPLGGDGDPFSGLPGS